MSYPPPPGDAPPPPPPAEPPLPPGWTCHYDATGRPYYHNAADNSTSWVSPVAAPQPPPPPPPPPPDSPPDAAPGAPPAGYPMHQPSFTHQPTAPHPGFVHQLSAPHPGFVQQPSGLHQPSGLYPGFRHQPTASHPGQPYPAMPPPYGGSPPQGPPMAQPSVMPGGSMATLAQGLSMVSIGPGGALGVVYISLEMKAVGLKKKDLIGTSDPLCFVHVPDEPQKTGAASQTHHILRWKPIGRTEILDNTTAPSWATRVIVPFHFEKHQPLRFTVIDVDNKKTLKGDSLGQCVVTLAEVVRNGLLTLRLTKNNGGSGGSFGELIVRAHDENEAGKVRVKLSLSASGLDKKDAFGKSDPYYVLKQVVGRGTGGTSTLYKSKEIMKTCDPTWEPHTLMIPTEGKPWEQVQLQAIVYDWDKFTPHDLIGEAHFNLAALTTTSSFDLINPKKAAKRKYKNSGQLLVHRADAVELPSFISFLQGGLRLNFIVAVDFTASNRPVDNPASLHYLKDPQRPSQYAQALHGIGTILSGYIPDGYITALGFGAVLPGQGNVASFDFALTGQPDPRVQGVSGLLTAYEQAATNVTLAGPTNFTPLIRNAMGQASAYPVSQTNQHFSILLILTDGIITDLSTTIDSIIECSYNTPMAIVIVGIGEADFAAMERLDGDQHALRSDSGRQAKHDIVQFAKFDRNKSVEVLAADVLQEVPQRVVEYMVDAGIRPNTPTF